MANENTNNNEELTREQKILILRLFKKGVYKKNNNVNTLIERLRTIWGIEEDEI